MSDFQENFPIWQAMIIMEVRGKALTVATSTVLKMWPMNPIHNLYTYQLWLLMQYWEYVINIIINNNYIPVKELK